jgi:hypothetical protein
LLVAIRTALSQLPRFEEELKVSICAVCGDVEVDSLMKLEDTVFGEQLSAVWGMFMY